MKVALIYPVGTDTDGRAMLNGSEFNSLDECERHFNKFQLDQHRTATLIVNGTCYDATPGGFAQAREDSK